MWVGELRSYSVREPGTSPGCQGTRSVAALCPFQYKRGRPSSRRLHALAEGRGKTFLVAPLLPRGVPLWEVSRSTGPPHSPPVPAAVA